MGKSTISMAIFNCYVSSPEGMSFVLTLCSMGLQNDTLYEPCWLNFATGRHSDVVQMKVTWQGETRGHKWSLIGNLSYKHSEFVVGHWHLHHWAKNP